MGTAADAEAMAVIIHDNLPPKIEVRGPMLKVVHTYPLPEGTEMQSTTDWRWLNPDTQQVEVWHCVTVFRDADHPNETDDEFYARHTQHIKDDRITHPKVGS